MLPLVMDARDFGLSPEKLHSFVEQESLLTLASAGNRPESPGRVGYFNPPIGVLLGKRLAARIGSLLNRPCCRFANAFLWRSNPGASQHWHLDRVKLDVTMSIPIVLEGTDRWPLRVEQPYGGHFEWASAPGTVLIVDGRQRQHGRYGAFEGTRAITLLLHWTAPAVLWPGFLGPGERSRLAATTERIVRGAPAGGALLDRCLELAQSAVARSVEPEAVVCGDLAEAAKITARGRGASFLVVLDGQAELTLDERGAVALQPGDGIAFPSKANVEIRWIRTGRGKAIVGRSMRTEIRY